MGRGEGAVKRAQDSVDDVVTEFLDQYCFLCCLSDCLLTVQLFDG